MVKMEKEEIDKVTKEIKVHYEKLVNYSDEINILFGNKNRLILLVVLNTCNEINKSELHKLLNKIGIKIAYKNVLWILDNLKEKNIISYERRKKENNSVYVIFNRKKFLEYLDKTKIFTDVFYKVLSNQNITEKRSKKKN